MSPYFPAFVDELEKISAKKRRELSTMEQELQSAAARPKRLPPPPAPKPFGPEKTFKPKSYVGPKAAVPSGFMRTMDLQHGKSLDGQHHKIWTVLGRQHTAKKREATKARSTAPHPPRAQAAPKIPMKMPAPAGLSRRGGLILGGGIAAAAIGGSLAIHHHYKKEWKSLTQLEKRSSPLSWLKNQYSHLSVAAGQALTNNTTHSALTGMKSVPILDTLKNFVGSKLPTPKSPPGPIAQKAQKVLSSKPVKTGIDLLGQTGEFLKLAGPSTFYHGTSGAALKIVKKRGLDPKMMGSGWEGRPDTREYPAISLTTNKHHAAVYAYLGKGDVLTITVPEGKKSFLKEVVPGKGHGGFDEWHYSARIPPEWIKTAGVEPYQQKTQYSCSAACLKAVLAHWGFDRFSEFELMHEIGVKDRGGAEVDQITEAAKRLGLSAYDKCFSSLDEARQLTDKEVPIIADFQSFNNPGKGHYVVIVRIEDDLVHLMDPNTEGNARVITRAECERRWWDRTMAPPHELMPKWGVVIEPGESADNQVQ